MTSDLREMGWIPVLRLDGGRELVGLRELFARAEEFSDLAPELTCQRDAVLRLALAILWSAVRVEGPDDWADLVESGDWSEQVLDYLDAPEGRWDLFDEEAPFFQTPSLRTAKGTHSGLEKLILDVPAGEQMFIGRQRSSYESISAREAALWLVTVMAFDPSGIKTGAVGDVHAKGGKGYPMGTAAAGRFHLVVALGETLAETLMLNLMPRETEPLAGADSEEDRPAWERPVPTAERQERLPDGPVDLLTWQSRRIRLVREGGRMVGVIIANGDAFSEQNAHQVEPFSIWRYSDPQTKKAGRTVFMPLMVDPAVQIWRGVSRLLGAVPGGPSKYPAPPAPAVVNWIGELAVMGKIDVAPRRFRASGVEYGTQSAVVSDLVDDSLALPVAALSAGQPAVSGLLVEGVEAAEQGVRALGRLAANLARAAGDRDDLSRDAGESASRAARQQGFAALDAPVRAWIASVDPAELDSCRRAWFAEARGILRDLGAEMVRTAPPAAWVPRESDAMDVPRADHYFQRALHTAFSLPDEPTTAAEEAARADR
ncbi:CRISPR-associated protein, Cse1 family [Kytococcus aerolatus]|uniref:CRISPR-associated protein, Cse1 family n=1 Tax=Kytococcus aerolatus TaxID=592308 RepID=A0A212U5F5_9MICO|nr:type I-E CRISPR-associated protein Cse1/CasA [Kytococcus aerolatus]SNC73493.1 CRISPR-associated protein, Cse1 family [Kytococcus aerolatus]